MPEFRTIYAEDDHGGIQLASSADRWALHDDYIHISPHHGEGECHPEGDQEGDGRDAAVTVALRLERGRHLARQGADRRHQ